MHESEYPLDSLPEDVAAAMMGGAAIGIMISAVPNQPPPEWEWMLENLRTMINDDGEALGMVLAATATETLMIPAPAGPHDPLRLLVAMVQSGRLGSICWVAVASDTYVRDGDMSIGSDGLTPTEAFKRGLPGSKEAILATCLAPDGPGFDVQQTYVRTPEGIEWAEPHQFPHSNQGALVDLMHAVVEA